MEDYESSKNITHFFLQGEDVKLQKTYLPYFGVEDLH